MELWDLYNRDGEKTGRRHKRGVVIPKGYYHMVVEIWIINTKGEYLIQKRNKPLNGHINPWSTTAGSVEFGESSIQGVIRECMEEVDISFTPVEVVFHSRTFFDDFFMDSYIAHWNRDISRLKFDPNEVSTLRWFTIEEIKKLKAGGEFYNYPTKYLKELLGDNS